MSSNLSGPQLVYKIISESEYVTDPSNNRSEIIENWYSKNIDERSTVIAFIKNSGQQFHDETDFRLADIAQRFKARRYFKGDMLKDFNEDPTYVWFICSGTVGIFERKVKIDEDETDDPKSSSLLEMFSNDKAGMEITLLNTYHAGQSFGDPEINMCTPFSSRVCITSNETKIV
jgi:hypothetical protein